MKARRMDDRDHVDRAWHLSLLSLALSAGNLIWQAMT